MDMRKWFFLSVIFLALVVGGCGGNGNGGGTAMMPGDDDDDEPMACPAGQMRNADGDCAAPPPVRTPPSMALVDGIVTANNKDNNATDPAHYNDDNRPGKAVDGEGDSTGDVLSIAVKRDGTIGDVNIAMDDGDPSTVLTNLRKLTMTEEMALSVGRFADGSVHSRTNMGVTDTVYVYETKSAPEARAWNMEYPRSFTTTDAITGVAPAATTPAGSQSFHVLTFGTDVSAISKRFASSMFPSSGSQTYTYHETSDYDALPTTGADARGATDIRGKMFDGMFHGVPGTYTCTGTCTSATNNRGELITLSTGWSFKPDNLAENVTGHMVQGAVEDADYLTFGYWVQKDDEDGEIGVGTFASGTQLDSTTYVPAMTSLVGTAEYDGKAVGKFALKTLSSTGIATITDGGTFTADANLTAHFGGPAVSFNDSFTVRGTIDDFRNSDGDAIDSNWSVTLRPSPFRAKNDDGSYGEIGTTFTGATSSGGPAGAWGGGFYGTPRTSTGAIDTPAPTNADAYPTGVAGEFDAHFTNGHVIGAFGATKDK